MSKLLYIEASPRGERSRSSTVAKAFVAGYKKAHPGDTVETVNVFDARLATLDEPTLGAKYAMLHGQNPTAEDIKRWKPVQDVMDQFKAADKYVISTPMWNFSIPYRLKHYIDLLVNPGQTFSYSPEEGYKGLVTGKPMLIVCARGGAYPEGAALDLQAAYLKLILAFIGFTDIQWILVEPTLAGRDVADAKTKAAVEQATQMAKAF